MEDEISPRCKTTLFSGSGQVICAQKPPRPSIPEAAAHEMLNSWPHSCSHSSTACSQPHPPAHGSQHSQSPWRQQGALSTLYLSLLLRCPLPSGATRALQPEDPKSLGSPGQARPLRRRATSHGAQQRVNYSAFTRKWKQVNLCNFITTVLGTGKGFFCRVSSRVVETHTHTHTRAGIWIRVGISRLYTKVLSKKKKKNKVAFHFFFKKWLNKCDPNRICVSQLSVSQVFTLWPGHTSSHKQHFPLPHPLTAKLVFFQRINYFNSFSSP